MAKKTGAPEYFAKKASNKTGLMLFPIDTNREPAITSTAAGRRMALRSLSRSSLACTSIALTWRTSASISAGRHYSHSLGGNENRPLIPAHALQVH